MQEHKDTRSVSSTKCLRSMKWHQRQEARSVNWRHGSEVSRTTQSVCGIVRVVRTVLCTGFKDMLKHEAPVRAPSTSRSARFIIPAQIEE